MTDALGQSVKFLEAMRVGKLPDSHIAWRHDSLLQEADTRNNFTDLTGGWMEGGNAGPTVFRDSIPQPLSRTGVHRAWHGLLSFSSRSLAIVVQELNIAVASVCPSLACDMYVMQQSPLPVPLCHWPPSP